MAAAQRSAHGDTLHSESLSDCEAEAAKKATGTKRRPSGSRLRYLHVSSNFAIIDQSINSPAVRTSQFPHFPASSRVSRVLRPRVHEFGPVRSVGRCQLGVLGPGVGNRRPLS
jgi:hypothetical protein